MAYGSDYCAMDHVMKWGGFSSGFLKLLGIFWKKYTWGHRNRRRLRFTLDFTLLMLELTESYWSERRATENIPRARWEYIWKKTAARLFQCTAPKALGKSLQVKNDIAVPMTSDKAEHTIGDIEAVRTPPLVKSYFQELWLNKFDWN